MCPYQLLSSRTLQIITASIGFPICFGAVLPAGQEAAAGAIQKSAKKLLGRFDFSVFRVCCWCPPRPSGASPLPGPTPWACEGSGLDSGSRASPSLGFLWAPGLSRILAGFMVIARIWHSASHVLTVWTIYNWAHGVVVSHPLSMRGALGSIPSVSNCALELWLCRDALARKKHMCTCACRESNPGHKHGRLV